MELGLLLDMAVEDDPSRVAVTDVDGTALTRGALRDAARRAACRLRAEGASQVGYLAGNGRALPVSLFGSALAGLPFVPLNYRLSDDQLGDIVRRQPGLVVVASDAQAARLERLQVTRVDTADLIASDQGAVGAGEEVDLPSVDPDAVAVVLYTSGTASAPKAALLRHRHLTAYVIQTVEFAAAGADEAVIVSVPPYHVAGVSTILSNLYSGRRIVYLDPFDPARWLELVRDEHVTHAMVVPTMLARIVDALDGRLADVPSLRSVAYGGSKMPAPVIERALQLFPDVGFTNAYGLTETSSTISVLGPEDHRDAVASDDPRVRDRLASAGRPVPGIELRVVDDGGGECPVGVVGDLLVRGEQVSGEYAGGSTLDGEGWFATRDRARLDDAGYLFIEGRTDDTIIRGGENIAPAEIEDVLLRHPDVAEAAVIGLPDEEWGQRIAAAVVLRPGRSTSPGELRDWVHGRLRSAKTPDVVEIWSELPYTPTGKLLRRQVQAGFSTSV